MEFTECLDAAVAEKDPHKRIAFVAAFAMSNYSSTIGRIAKPFNPMLVSYRSSRKSTVEVNIALSRERLLNIADWTGNIVMSLSKSLIIPRSGEFNGH
jgi:hypothetical protein